MHSKLFLKQAPPNTSCQAIADFGVVGNVKLILPAQRSQPVVRSNSVGIFDTSIVNSNQKDSALRDDNGKRSDQPTPGQYINFNLDDIDLYPFWNQSERLHRSWHSLASTISSNNQLRCLVKSCPADEKNAHTPLTSPELSAPLNLMDLPEGKCWELEIGPRTC